LTQTGITVEARRFWPRVRSSRLVQAWLPPFAAVVVLLGGWEVAVQLSDIDPTLWCPPSRVIRAIPKVLGSDLFWQSALTTLKLLTLGFISAAVLGIGFGLVLGRIKILDRALSPWANALYAAPLPAFIPIITAAVGFGLNAKLFVVTVIGVFPILFNTYQGVSEVDPNLIEVARSFRSSEGQIWRNVLIPYTLPFVLVGLRLGVVRCMIGTVVAEFFTSPGGLGYLILVYTRRFNIAATLVPVMALTALGMVLIGIVRRLERVITPWQEQ
jgi:ABC-type nitrate/sulfonate/bicarbonate transport system permease component